MENDRLAAAASARYLRAACPASLSAFLLAHLLALLALDGPVHAPRSPGQTTRHHRALSLAIGSTPSPHSVHSSVRSFWSVHFGPSVHSSVHSFGPFTPHHHPFYSALTRLYYYFIESPTTTAQRPHRTVCSSKPRVQLSYAPVEVDRTVNQRE